MFRRGAIYCAPTEIPERFLNIYRKAKRNVSIPFDRAVQFYDETRGFPSGEEKGAAAAIAQAGKFSGQERVLEIGVGTGRIALPAAPFARAYIGVDISLPMMARLCQKQTHERVGLAQADATRLPFPAATFDAAAAVHVFHLIPNWPEALGELARVLRPGGLLVHCVTDSDELLDVNAILRTAFPDPENTVGTRSKTFLEESGWRLVGEETHEYTKSHRPIDLVNVERQRISSRTWSLSDEEVEARARLVEKAVHERFADPGQAVDVPHRFRARAYLPPSPS
jgi:ubiquinone/menaquinone biosynthesis C-methylase UbiE